MITNIRPDPQSISQNQIIKDLPERETPIAMIFRILEESRPSQELLIGMTEPPRLWPPF